MWETFVDVHVGRKTLHLLQQGEKGNWYETGPWRDRGRCGQGQSCHFRLNPSTKWKGRTFSTWGSGRGNGSVFLRVNDQVCQRKADVLGRHLHVIKHSGFWLKKLAVANFQPTPCNQRRKKACQGGKWIEESLGETWPLLPTLACIRLINLGLPKLGFGVPLHTRHVPSSGHPVFVVVIPRDLSDGVFPIPPAAMQGHAACGKGSCNMSLGRGEPVCNP